MPEQTDLEAIKALNLAEIPLSGTHAQLAELIELRDYMAMAALPTVLDFGIPALGDKINDNIVMANKAYEIADAMLRARKGKNETKA